MKTIHQDFVSIGYLNCLHYRWGNKISESQMGKCIKYISLLGKEIQVKPHTDYQILYFKLYLHMFLCML